MAVVSSLSIHRDFCEIRGEVSELELWIIKKTTTEFIKLKVENEGEVTRELSR